MPKPDDEQTFAQWRELCSIFRARRILFPRWKYFLPSIPSWRNDHISFQQNSNPEWVKATELLETLSTPALHTLHRFAKVNLVLTRRVLTSSVWMLSVLFAGAAGLVSILHGYIFEPFSASELLDTGLQLRPAVEGIVLLIGLGAYCYLLKLTWVSKEQAQELCSCLEVALALRQRASTTC